MKNVTKLCIALSLALPLAACGGDDDGDTGVSTTNTVPTGGDDGTPTAGDDDGTPTSTAGDDDGMPTTGSADDGLPTTGGPDDTTGGGGGGGFCAISCAAAADCVPPMGNEADWACTEGFCEFTGALPACDPATCDDLGVGLACADVDGVSQCTTPCPNGDECTAPLECSGMDDAGNAICAAAPCGGVAEGEACDIPNFGQIGTCTDGVCGCTDDAECTAPGYACNG